MAGKKRTTFAKMNREQKLRERQMEKEMRKEARKGSTTALEDSIAAPIDLDADETLASIDEVLAREVPGRQ